MSSHGSKRAEKDPYMRGYLFWNTNRYWHKATYPQWFKDQSDEWVDSMQQDTRSLAAVDKKYK